MLVSATMFVAGAAIANENVDEWGDLEFASSSSLTTGGSSILFMMPSILGAVKVGLEKMKQTIE